MTELSHDQLRAICDAIDFKVRHLEKLSWQMLPFVSPREFVAHNTIIESVYQEIKQLKEAKAAVSKVYEELLKQLRRTETR